LGFNCATNTLYGKCGNQDLMLIDEMRFNQISITDIHDEEILDIAARFDIDEEAYGWCNDNYISEPLWRAPQWRLNQGNYLVKVKIVSANTEKTELFRIINSGPINDFRLEDARPDDKAF
jgi:hypothetical protein